MRCWTHRPTLRIRRVATEAGLVQPFCPWTRLFFKYFWCHMITLAALHARSEPAPPLRSDALGTFAVPFSTYTWTDAQAEGGEQRVLPRPVFVRSTPCAGNGAGQLPDREAIFAYLEGTYSSPTRNIPERIARLCIWAAWCVECLHR